MLTVPPTILGNCWGAVGRVIVILVPLKVVPRIIELVDIIILPSVPLIPATRAISYPAKSKVPVVIVIEVQYPAVIWVTLKNPLESIVKVAKLAGTLADKLLVPFIATLRAVGRAVSVVKFPAHLIPAPADVTVIAEARLTLPVTISKKAAKPRMPVNPDSPVKAAMPFHICENLTGHGGAGKNINLLTVHPVNHVKKKFSLHFS